MQEIRSNWLSLLKYTFPVAMGYYAAGIAYGILAISNDLPVWLIVGMSVLVYSGAAQYAAIPLFVSGAGFFSYCIGHAVYELAFYFLYAGIA